MRGTDHSDSLHVPKGHGQEALSCEGHLGLTISHVTAVFAGFGFEFVPETCGGRQTGTCGSVEGRMEWSVRETGYREGRGLRRGEKHSRDGLKYYKRMVRGQESYS